MNSDFENLKIENANSCEYSSEISQNDEISHLHSQRSLLIKRNFINYY